MDSPKPSQDLLRRMASTVGHDLRNPLAVINNSAYFVKAKLKADKNLDPKVEKHLGIIEAEIQRANRLIGDMLAYSRPLELKPEACSLAKLAEEALAAYSFPKGIKIVKKLAGKVQIQVDAQHLKDTLKRLFDNAVDAMPEGGTLKVSIFEKKDLAGIEVSDTGSGIAPDILADVFLPFYSTKPKGLGLGLALARKVAEAHKGRVELEVPKGPGIVVRILLPS